MTDADPAPMKNFRKDGDLYDRQYMHQPPLIPHDTRNYEVDNKVNKCLACHSFKNASAMKAPKISPTHFETRDGMTLGEVSPVATSACSATCRKRMPSRWWKIRLNQLKP